MYRIKGLHCLKFVLMTMATPETVTVTTRRCFISLRFMHASLDLSWY